MNHTKVKNILKAVAKVENLSPLLLLRRLEWYTSKYILKKHKVTRKIHEFDMILDTTTSGISKTLFTRRKREEDMTLLIRRVLKPGMTVFDCGANIGYYALLEAECVGDSGKVITIEPDPRNIPLLKLNLENSKYRNIFDFEHLALSDYSGHTNLELTEHSNLNKVDKYNTTANSYQVKCSTFKDFLGDRVSLIDFVRMDIEGHEVEVFESIFDSKDDLKSGFTIFLEVHPNEYHEEHSFKQILDKFLDSGFYCKYIVSAGTPQPKRFKEKGYTPSEVIKSDGFLRGIYDDINDKEDILDLVCELPKMSRYLMITKR